MFKDLSLEEFLETNRINQETWDKADIEWLILQSIAADHEEKSVKLEDSAEVIAKTIQKFSKVHSVRWRVKSPEHLIAKIIRKRAEKCPKYADITLQNYFALVTDLVGVRALHLFKVECFEIDQSIRDTWNQIEAAVAYIRTGDSAEMKGQFQNQDFEVKEHGAGYRSVHYVIESTPHKRKIIAEIQVRTIFEEGWSEIDHKIRYPNFSNNELVGYFLEIFNRMAGSADDMGGFVLGLVSTLDQLQNEIAIITKEKDNTLLAMEEALKQLESVKKQDDASKESVATLKTEVAKLKGARNDNSLLNLLNNDNKAWPRTFGELEKAKSLASILGSTSAELHARNSIFGNNKMLAELMSANSALQAQKALLGASPLADILGSNALLQANKDLHRDTIGEILKATKNRF